MLWLALRIEEMIRAGILEVVSAGDGAHNKHIYERVLKMSTHKLPFLGLPKPLLNKVIKPYIKIASKEDVDWGFVDVCWEKDYREAKYTGVDYLIAVQKKLLEQDLDKLKKLIVTKSWWDTADSLDRLVGLLVQNIQLFLRLWLIGVKAIIFG